MSREIVLQRHQVEAWGLWWIQWQKELKERLRRHRMSPQAFVDKHLVGSEGESFSLNTTVSNTLPSK